MSDKIIGFKNLSKPIKVLIVYGWFCLGITALTFLYGVISALM